MDEAGFLSDDGSLTSAHSQKELQELQELQEQGPIHLTPSPNIVVLNFEQDSAITLPIPIEQQKRKRTYRINGTNLLNNHDHDSKQVFEKIRRRRAQHSVYERGRTASMNAVLNELSENVPEVVKGDSKVAIMQKAVQYIKHLQDENQRLKSQMSMFQEQESYECEINDDVYGTGWM